MRKAENFLHAAIRSKLVFFTQMAALGFLAAFFWCLPPENARADTVTFTYAPDVTSGGKEANDFELTGRRGHFVGDPSSPDMTFNGPVDTTTVANAERAHFTIDPPIMPGASVTVTFSFTERSNLVGGRFTSNGTIVSETVTVPGPIVGAGLPNEHSDRVHPDHRSGRLRLCREHGAARRQCDRFYPVRIQPRRKMAGAAQGAGASSNARGRGARSDAGTGDWAAGRDPGNGPAARR
jgi:hypothetical protein